MSWVDVARKDFVDAVQANVFLGLAGLTLVLAAGAGAYPRVGGDPSVEAGISAMFGTMSFILPVIAFVVTYRAVAGERESGSLRLLLSLPLDRWEVLAGKLAGRMAVVLVPVAVGFALAVPSMALLYGGFDGPLYLEFLLPTLAHSLVYVAIALGVSAAVSTPRRAVMVLAAVFGAVYFLLYTIPNVLHYLLYGTVPETPTDWMLFIERLPPHEAVSTVWNAVVDGAVLTDEVVYLQPWVSLLVFGAWLVGPLALGYWRFARLDVT